MLSMNTSLSSFPKVTGGEGGLFPNINGTGYNQEIVKIAKLLATGQSFEMIQIRHVRYFHYQPIQNNWGRTYFLM